VLQIHVMAEYVERGLRAMKEALRLAMDYFRMDQEAFLAQWLPGRMKELERQTTPASWRAIVESLNNPAQARIVADDREQTSVLVLAGPGSGKTRVLVHRIAYLLRVRREQPHGILALAYNRHAAVEIRRRLDALVGADAKGVLVMTCHAFAMRLTGTSFRGQALHDEEAFRAVIRDAVALLKGEGVAPEEADLQRERLLGGFRWILVDEYQDIGPDQYELISALAGRSRGEDDGRLSLFAVGDDDQNIYGYAGASVEFIRRFEADYAARAAYLVENYRSSAHIIDCANRLIAPAAQRMKAAQPIAINRARAKLPAGGSWQERDPVAEGRVQLLSGASDAMGQAAQAMMELQRLAQRDPKWDWSRVAVIARNWKLLDPLRAYCELHRIPAQMANEEAAHFWQLRETRALAAWLRERGDALTDGAEMLAWLDARPAGPWCDLLQEAARQYALETVGEALPAAHAVEWLAEWGREVRRRQHGLLLTTAHRAKGLEFDHVAVLDGGWQRAEPHEDRDAPRRLLYVAMTRARHTLLLTAMGAPSALLRTLDDAPGMLRREAPMPSPLPAQLYRRHLRPGLKEIDIGFAGRRAENDATHRAIAALRAGDALTLRHAGERYELLDASGCVVGRMAQAFTAPAGMRCIAARVHALLVRRRDDADAAYQASLRCEEWELVLPELVFEPEFSG
jgi:ATP-dependent DNA helicase RecQ